MTTTALPEVLPLIGLEGIILKAGGHDRRARGVCAMEAVAWIAGETHSDKPQCACPVIGAFMRNWNDNLPDDDSRTRILRPLIPLLVGTRSTAEVEWQRSWMALDWLCREHAPAWLSLRDDLKAHAVALRGLKPITDTESAKAAQETLSAARSAASAAWDAARAAAWDAARAAARAAARDAARAAAGAAAGDAAWDAARAAAWDAARAAARAAARDAAGAAAWDAAGDAARAAARAAAKTTLQPTVDQLQLSAAELVKRMCAVKAA